MHNKTMPLLYAFIVLGFMVGTVRSSKAEIYSEIPEAVDHSRKYLFYMHGAWVEMKGLNEAHPRYGLYKYDKIVQSFSNKGFVVISEARLRRVRIGQYANKVARQVSRLLDQGVPRKKITVIGHSKGGLMALTVASILGEREINFVVMAGCAKKGTRFRRSYEKFLQTHAQRLRGRILSIYEADDRSAGSCQEAFNLAPDIESKEVVFNTGRGHGLFYSPERIWINEVIKWAGI